MEKYLSPWNLKLERKLKCMVELDIIEPVQKPTKLVNGLVIVQKPNGKLRVCLELRPSHKSLKNEHFHLSTANKFFSKMSGASSFSKLDASSGYWLIKVHKQSSTLLEFGTPSGRYRFKRLPFWTYQVLQFSKVTLQYGGKF